MEWQVLYDLDPWGEERADLRSGTIAAAAANAGRMAAQAMGAKLAGEPFRPRDFMPAAEPEPPLEPDRLRAKIFAAMGALGAKIDVA